MLDRQTILDCDDKKVSTIKVEQWGGQIHIRTLDGLQADRVLKLMGNGSAEIDKLIGIVLTTVCDAEGNLLFKAEDKLKLKTKNLLALRTIAEAAITLNGLDADVEELAKNSEGDPTT